MSGVTAPINTGGGGLDAGSSATGQSGDIRGGNRAFGGINIAPDAGLFTIKNLLIVGGIAVGYLILRKRKIF